MDMPSHFLAEGQEHCPAPMVLMTQSLMAVEFVIFIGTARSSFGCSQEPTQEVMIPGSSGLDFLNL